MTLPCWIYNGALWLKELLSELMNCEGCWYQWWPGSQRSSRPEVDPCNPGFLQRPRWTQCSQHFQRWNPCQTLWQRSQKLTCCHAVPPLHFDEETAAFTMSYDPVIVDTERYLTFYSLGTEWTWAARKRTTKEMNRVSLILANMRWICNMPQICRATPELWGVQSPFGVHQQLSRSKVKPHPFIPTVFMPSPSPWPELLITFLLHLVARGCSNHQNLGQLSQIRLRQRG